MCNKHGVVGIIVRKSCWFIVGGLISVWLTLLAVSTLCYALTPEEALAAAIRKKAQSTVGEKRSPVTQKSAGSTKSNVRRERVSSASGQTVRVKPAKRTINKTRVSNGKRRTAVRSKIYRRPIRKPVRAQRTREEPPVAATIWP